MVVYRVSPPDVESGVRVGEVTYPGFPNTAAGLGRPGTEGRIFRPVVQPVARRADGNRRTAMSRATRRAVQFEHRVFQKKFRSSRIPLDDKFLGAGRARHSANRRRKSQASPDDLLPAFLKINNDLRRMNNETIAALAKKTAPSMLWDGVFQPLGGLQVESAFADSRTYLYDGKDVDRQVHLGFDLAKTANSPVAAGK